MYNEIENVIEKAIGYYTQQEHYPELLKAQEIYFYLTGKISSDEEDFESRMSNFYEWYLFHYKATIDQKTRLELFLEMNPVSQELLDIVTKIQFSVIRYKGKNLLGTPVFKDLVTGKSFKLIENHRPLVLVSGDIFLGRYFFQEKKVCFFKSLYPLPSSAVKLIRKQGKKVHKKGNAEEIIDFLLKVEACSVKLKHYQHVPIQKIFVFGS